MLSLVLLSYFIHASLSLPIPPNDSTKSNDSIRTVPGIVISCLTTMFACTWTSIHPNIPPRRLSDRQLLWLRVKIFIVALVAPELIVNWALIQFRCSRQAVKRIREELPPNVRDDLTYTHGMFLVMGGFVLDEEGKDGLVLQESDIINHLRDHKISFPEISKNQIKDRSKVDGLGKLVAIGQTAWFMAQVISRAVQHLPITELELTTVAFALLNVIIYVLWWKKPQNVRYPIMVPLLQEKQFSPHTPPSVLAGDASGASIQLHAVLACDSTNPRQPPSSTVVLERPSIGRILIHTTFDLFSGILDLRSTFRDAICNPLTNLCSKEPIRHNVPTFYGGSSKLTSCGYYLCMETCIGVLFGSIHCFAWAFQFPSTVEQQVWQIMSLCITLSPLMFPILIKFVVEKKSKNWVTRVLTVVCGVIMALIYPLARLSTFVLAFSLLQDLPAGALIDVKWSKFVPHL